MNRDDAIANDTARMSMLPNDISFFEQTNVQFGRQLRDPPTSNAMATSMKMSLCLTAAEAPQNMQLPPACSTNTTEESELQQVYLKGLDDGVRLAQQLTTTSPPSVLRLDDVGLSGAFLPSHQGGILASQQQREIQERSVSGDDPVVPWYLRAPAKRRFHTISQNGVHDLQEMRQSLIANPSSGPFSYQASLVEEDVDLEKRYAKEKRNKANWRTLVSICQECIERDAVCSRTKPSFWEFCKQVVAQHNVWQQYDGYNNKRQDNIDIMCRFARMGNSHPNKDFLKRAKRVYRCFLNCPDGFQRLCNFEKPLSQYNCPKCQNQKTFCISKRRGPVITSDASFASICALSRESASPSKSDTVLSPKSLANTTDAIGLNSCVSFDTGTACSLSTMSRMNRELALLQFEQQKLRQLVAVPQTLNLRRPGDSSVVTDLSSTSGKSSIRSRTGITINNRSSKSQKSAPSSSSTIATDRSSSKSGVSRPATTRTRRCSFAGPHQQQQYIAIDSHSKLNISLEKFEAPSFCITTEGDFCDRGKMQEIPHEVYVVNLLQCDLISTPENSLDQYPFLSEYQDFREGKSYRKAFFNAYMEAKHRGSHWQYLMRICQDNLRYDPKGKKTMFSFWEFSRNAVGNNGEAVKLLLQHPLV